MARRKAELLDLLRKQQQTARRPAPPESAAGEEPPEAVEAPAAEAQASAPAEPAGEPAGELAGEEAAEGLEPPAVWPPPSARAGRRAPRPSPVLPLLAVLLVAVPLVLWMVQEWGEGGAAGGGAEGGDGGSGVSAAAATARASRREPAAGTAPAAEQAFSVLLITYAYNDANLQQARRLWEWLEREGFGPVRPLGVPSDAPRHIQVFVGEAASPAELEGLLERLKPLRPPWVPRDQPPPFASALIQRLPSFRS